MAVNPSHLILAIWQTDSTTSHMAMYEAECYPFVVLVSAETNLDSRSGVDGRNVLRDHAVPVALVVEDGIAILRGLAVAAGECVAILPEHVSGDALGSQGCRLPRVLDRAVVGSSIYFSVCVSAVRFIRAVEWTYTLRGCRACWQPRTRRRG